MTSIVARKEEREFRLDDLKINTMLTVVKTCNAQNPSEEYKTLVYAGRLLIYDGPASDYEEIVGALERGDYSLTFGWDGFTFEWH